MASGKAVGLHCYETYVPCMFRLDDGELVNLSAREVEERLAKEDLFFLWVPSRLVDEVYRCFKDSGFGDVALCVSKGEKYGLSKVVYAPWEFHVRIFEDGLILGEVEVSREYFEHLAGFRINVVYEVFEVYRGVYDRLCIFCKPAGRWVTGVERECRVLLKPPGGLTPWKPVVASVLVLAAVGLTWFAIDRLRRGGEE